MKQYRILNASIVFFSLILPSVSLMAAPIGAAIKVNISTASDISKSYEGFDAGMVSYSCAGMGNSIYFTPDDINRGVSGAGCSAQAWTPTVIGPQVGLESDMGAVFGSAEGRIDNYIFDFTVNSAMNISFDIGWYIEADASSSTDVSLASLYAVLEITGTKQSDSLALSMYNQSLYKDGEFYTTAAAVSSSDTLSLSARAGDIGRLALSFRASARRELRSRVEKGGHADGS